jgi:hypothetical protein
MEEKEIRTRTEMAMQRKREHQGLWEPMGARWEQGRQQKVIIEICYEDTTSREWTTFLAAHALICKLTVAYGHARRVVKAETWLQTDENNCDYW